jgi:1-acyl-sn-glycerol-3-phosphate acyltransferase
MRRILPGWFIAVFAVTLGVTVTVLIFVLMFLVPGLAKVLIPIPAWQRACTSLLLVVVTFWARCVTACMNLAQQPRWDIRWPDGLSPRGKYLLLSNHSSWLDIPVLLRIFPGHIPFTRYFIKQQLIWLPLIGFAAWAIDCPFMRRYTREQLERHPELRGKDLETTRRACEHLRHHPLTIVNFAEGTRMTEAKRSERGSPYRHLLRPKSAGVAFVLSCMGEHSDAILNVTIAYPPGKPASYWDYLCGRIREVAVRVEKIPVPAEFIHGDYQDDPAFQKRFQAWMTEIWDSKDRLIDELHAGMAQASP